jgi:hypothetical protein
MRAMRAASAELEAIRSLIVARGDDEDRRLYEPSVDAVLWDIETALRALRRHHPDLMSGS